MQTNTHTGATGASARAWRHILDLGVGDVETRSVTNAPSRPSTFFTLP